MIETDSDEGRTTLVVNPSSIVIENQVTRLSIRDGRVERADKRARKRRLWRPEIEAIAIRAGELFVTRDWPTQSIGLWHAYDSTRIRPLWRFAAKPVMSDHGVDSIPDFDRFAYRLQTALGELGFGHGSGRAFGRGKHQALEIERDRRLCIYARPVFKEHPRLVLSFSGEGDIQWFHRRDGQTLKSVTLDKRFDVVATGDRIRFVNSKGDDVGHVFLPWIGTVDRAEIARRMQHMVDQINPPPSYDAKRAPSFADLVVKEQKS